MLVERKEILLGKPVLLRKEYISNCVTLWMEDGLISKKVKNVLKQNQEIGKKQRQDLVQIQKHNMVGNLALGKLLRLEIILMCPKNTKRHQFFGILQESNYRGWRILVSFCSYFRESL